MPDYLPTVTTQVAPIISASTNNGVSYEEIQQSIGSYAFQLTSLYVYTPNNISQLLLPIYLRKYNKQGDRTERSLFMNIDPFQYTAALNVDFKELDYRFDSNNNFYLTIQPNTTINLRIGVVEISPNIFFPEGTSNFDEIDFLSDYMIDF